jgi:hypothetical protein
MAPGRVPVNRRGRMRGLRETIEKFVASLRHRGFTAEEISAELARFGETRSPQGNA